MFRNSVPSPVDGGTTHRPTNRTTLASTMFQFKKIVLMPVCENTKSLMNTSPISTLWVLFSKYIDVLTGR